MPITLHDIGCFSIMEKKRIRADQMVLSQGLASDLKQASAMILAGEIVAKSGGQEWRIEKPGDQIDSGTVFRKKAVSNFVSRGGDKLLSAVQSLGLKGSFKDKRVLDVGASTGGFTDCVLSLGSKEVVAIDVGKNQLAWKLRKDPRVLVFEGTHICDAEKSVLGTFDWILADISFNSLARLLPCVEVFSKPGTHCLLLVKPQFELSRSEVPPGGVVMDPSSREKAISSVQEEMAQRGIHVLGVAESSVHGRSGNIEVFIYGCW